MHIANIKQKKIFVSFIEASKYLEYLKYRIMLNVISEISIILAT